MPRPLTFGVEMEFALGYVAYLNGDLKPWKPAPEKNTKFIEFPPNPAYNSDAPHEFQYTFYEHIANTIRRAGYPCIHISSTAHCTDISKWVVETNLSIRPPPGPFQPYPFEGVELKTPALPFNDTSLTDVASAVQLLNDKYAIANHRGTRTGLHVHVGHHSAGFSLMTIKKLCAFLWTFEPQLQTLHPDYRYYNEYFRCSIRSPLLNMNYRYGREYWILPPGQWGLAKILGTKTLKELIGLMSLVQEVGAGRYVDYNLCNLENEMGTVEFRGHAGTMDPQEIVMWVRVVVGIIQYVERTPLFQLHKLLASTLKQENDAIKEGLLVAYNNRQVLKLGNKLWNPPLLTVVDLLKKIGLQKPAEYYSDKLYRRTLPVSLPDCCGQRKAPIPQGVWWKHVSVAKSGDTEVAVWLNRMRRWKDYQHSDILRRIWDRFRYASDTIRSSEKSDGPGWQFSDKGEGWPEYTEKEVEKAILTDKPDWYLANIFSRHYKNPLPISA